MTTKKIALFIDADNISAKFGRQIIETLEKRGEIFIRRIYGNWEKNILHGWNECILNFSLRPVQQHDFTAGKNATDMSLTIDAMDVLYGGKAEIFALVSNDSDFTPLVIRLREGGMNIVGIGNSHAANSFRSACNEFIDLDATAVKIPAKPKGKISPASQKMSQGGMNIVGIGNSHAANSFRSACNEFIDPDATAVKTPAKPTEKISPASQNPPVQMSLFDDDKVVTLKPEPKKSATVQPVKKVPSPVKKNSKIVSITAQKNPHDKIHDTLRETAKAHADSKGFVDLTHAGQNLHDKNLTIKGLGHSSLSKFVSAFPKLYEVRTVGKSVCYRCL